MGVQAKWNSQDPIAGKICQWNVIGLGTARIAWLSEAALTIRVSLPVCWSSLQAVGRLRSNPVIASA